MAPEPQRGRASAAKLLRHQEPGLLGADRHDRPVAARQARSRKRARGNPRHRQRHHRDQELRDVDLRAGGTARGHLQRRSGLRSAGAAAGPRRHRRHHGQRRRKNVYIEVNGKIEQTGIRFRDNQQLLNICQRIVSQVGRRVDESSPICDARLPDGSRVNVIAPPLAIDGAALTIRKFKKDKLTLDQLVRFGAISPEGAEVLKIIGRVRCNIVISGGTGSGKTTLLNCLTNYIDRDERVITCEDSAELQLQQPHVVRLETRPPNLEGEGEITMRDLVKNCLRMRPERIIVGEVRGPEVFDLLQAMNTGHDGSMGTIHSNSPRECLNRIESMIAMGGFTLPQKTVREIIVGSIDVIIQAARLRDGSRRITHITEVIGMEGDVIITQDLVLYEIEGEDANGRLIGEHVSTGIGRPHFWDRARYYGEEQRLAAALEAMEKRAD